MTGFNTRIGAAVLVGLATVYMGASLATGRSARAERPMDLKADDLGLDVVRAASYLLKSPGQVAVVDTRSPERFALYHLPMATSVPFGDAESVLKASNGKSGLLIVTDSDKDSSALAAQLLKAKPDLHFLKEGVRAWYLTFEVPVPLFTEKEAPRGYAEALGTVKSCLLGSCGDSAKASEALDLLAKSSYEPTMLQGKKPAAAAASKKKIAGGCGG